MVNKGGAFAIQRRLLYCVIVQISPSGSLAFIISLRELG